MPLHDSLFNRGYPAECETTLALASDGDAPSRARLYVSERAAALPADLLADALVLVSELVTNAINYGRPAITLRMRSKPPSIGISVADSGSDLPRLARGLPDPTVTSGRGLLIVAALANNWGVTRHDPLPGKTVWFELHP
jgi:anti-sigma regulatory factor (Ser/Thr protein kinase)